eukprot:7712915-Lingulodinium_polyedra.AAC.1
MFLRSAMHERGCMAVLFCCCVLSRCPGVPGQDMGCTLGVGGAATSAAAISLRTLSSSSWYLSH